MKRDDLRLERLFKAAKAARPAPAEEIPPYLAGRVIAHWRAGTIKDDSWQMLAMFFRRAVVCAGIVMLFTVVWSYDGLDTTPDNYEAYANSQLRADVIP